MSRPTNYTTGLVLGPCAMSPSSREAHILRKKLPQQNTRIISNINYEWESSSHDWVLSHGAKFRKTMRLRLRHPRHPHRAPVSQRSHSYRKPKQVRRRRGRLSPFPAWIGISTKLSSISGTLSFIIIHMLKIFPFCPFIRHNL